MNPANEDPQRAVAAQLWQRRYRLARQTIVTSGALCFIFGALSIYYGLHVLPMFFISGGLVYVYWLKTLSLEPPLHQRIQLLFSVLSVIVVIGGFIGPHAFPHMLFASALPLTVALFSPEERAWQNRLMLLCVAMIAVFETNRWLDIIPGFFDPSTQAKLGVIAVIILGVTMVSRIRFLADATRDNEHLLAQAHQAALDDRRRLQDAQGLAMLGSLTYFPDTQQQRWSPEMYAIHGLSPHIEVDTLTLLNKMVLPEDLAPLRDAAREALETEQPRMVSWRIRWPNGSVRYLQGSFGVQAARAGAPRTLLGTVLDVTELKTRELALEQARRDAIDASRAKSQFLANMSHEIRTPLNGVLGMLGLSLEGRLEIEQREYIEAARTSADHLLTILNDILDLSKIEAGKMELESIPFSSRGLIKEVARAMAGKAQEKELELVVDIDPQLPALHQGDPVRVRQILLNLLGNAIKFTAAGEVVIRAVHTPDALLLSVEDSGIGIPPDRLATIFDAFSQADTSTTRRFGGTGLGLTICKDLARKMGGDITVESVVGHGSTFHARLALPPLAPAPLSPPILAGQRALLYEPNARLRSALTRGLEAAGAIVTPCQTVPDARSRLAALSPMEPSFSLAILADRGSEDDSQLAGGLSLHPRLTHARCLLLSPAMRRPEREQAEQLHLARALLKPILIEDLLEACAPAPTDMEASARALPAARPLYVLLAEDNAINARVAMRMLEKMGHSVVHARDGREALALVQREPVDVVLMDMQMPEVDGLEATRQIRAWESAKKLPRLPIFALTANAMKSDADLCLAAGMDAWLTKPIQPAQLRSALEEVGSTRPAQHRALNVR